MQWDSDRQFMVWIESRHAPGELALQVYLNKCNFWYVFSGFCALYDDQIIMEAPSVPSTSRPANPEYSFEYIGNRQLEKLSHTFTVSLVK